ncbi:CCAAT/enhancer-binding protein zeta isoform X2 [Hemicordylus capensis]|uniref:CCAAT/enhancer-binding protein zeta isoform X2 n=1 Tax=Hemicordylus capensis TaxID=884348 RepID=UPI0023039FF0|nr:CCAAT/enhancer-binding protein zeta isoform X2 [Hemicordylus capensis]
MAGAPEEQDYIMLASLDETEELVDGGKKGAIDDLNQGELETFINSLGVSKYSKTFLLAEEEGTVVESEGKPQKKERASQKEVNINTVGKKENQVKESKGKTQSSDAKDSKKKSVPATDKTVLPEKKKEKEETFQFHERQVLLIKPGGKWYDLEYTNELSTETPNLSLASKYKTLAQKLYQQEADLYKNKTNLQKGSSSAWIKTVVSSGTLADRMAAMTLLIQDASVHSLEFIETLVNLIKKKGSRRQSLMALDTFKELLMTHLLPDNRKLHTFAQRPFGTLEKLSSGNRDSRDRRLILWYFEHQLKHWVAEFVQVLEALTHDTLVATKARALAVAHELLCNKLEEEKAFLVQLVNKLGDPQNKVATKASYLLETLLYKHPNMKGVVCNEVEKLLYRSNISPKAQYYAICFLNQIVLSHEESELANKLITIYFSFFQSCIKKKDVESKMLSALLTGVNRAYPYAQTSDEKVKEQMDTLFKVLHLVNFNTSVQALMLLFQVMDSNQTVSDRYYTVLYKKLLDPGLALCAKQSMFLNLVYKSLKADMVLRRVKAFVKRLLQVTCGQMPPFACGALYLVSEVLKTKPGLRVQLQDHVESDDEEHFHDLEEEEENLSNADKKTESKIIGESVKAHGSGPGASWVHHQNLAGSKNVGSYDPFHRNPSYCGADRTSFWELKKLSEHFHPSVALFAKTILEGNYIEYSGDPLQDFTLMRFLDRFVYRNPKAHKGKENTSSVVMQPKKKQSLRDVRNLAVNSKEFLAQDESRIPVDEIFFHRFYKKWDMEKQKRKLVGDAESVEDVDDDEFERALDSFEQDSYYDTIDKDDLNFAGNIKSKTGKKSQTDEVDLEDSDEFDDLDDEEVSLGSMDRDFGEELDEEGGTFMDVADDNNSPDENEEDEVKPVNSKKGKRKKEMDFAGSIKGSKDSKKRKLGDTGMLAAAEEFGYLLDENVGSKFDSIGINAMANTDNANFKQLRWEAERDRWIHNKDVKSIIKQKKKFKHKTLKNKKGKKTKT